jgi:hypothetical protein
MTRIRLTIPLLLLLVGAAVAVAADKPVGNWDCVALTPNGGEMKFTLNLKEQDGKLVGTAQSDTGEIAVEDAKFENGTLSFKVTLDSGSYIVTLKVDHDKLDGNWKAESGGDTGEIRGVKKA